MNRLLRLKLSLLLCLALCVCLAMALSSGWQQLREGSSLSGLMSPPGNAPSPKPADPTPTSAPQGVSPQPARLSPIRWTPAVELRNLNELTNPTALLNRPLNLPNRTDKLTLVDSRGRQAVVRTCGEYLQFKKDRYTFKTAYDNAMESFAKAQVYPLLYLRRAIPSRQSFLGNFDVTANPLGELPATLVPARSPDAQQRIAKLVAGGATFKQVFPAARATTVDKNIVRITDRDMDFRLGTLAWGDFNRDGFEDVLLSLSCSTRDGTLVKFGFAFLTRLRPDGPLLVIEVRE